MEKQAGRPPADVSTESQTAPPSCESLLKPGQRLELVRYFTSRIRGDANATGRQAMFIDALHARGGIEIDFGHFLTKTTQCRHCGACSEKREEKKTDANIAVHILDDAYDDRFDTAMVISGDSDLVPPVESVRKRFPEKRVVVATPPKRRSTQLAQATKLRLTTRHISTHKCQQTTRREKPEMPPIRDIDQGHLASAMVRKVIETRRWRLIL